MSEVSTVDVNIHEQFSKTWDLFFVPGYCVEVRALGLHGNSRLWTGYATGSIVGYFNDRDEFTSKLEQLDKLNYTAAYVTINPVKPELIGRAHNRFVAATKENCVKTEDIAYLRWLRADIDPVRSSGIPSTDNEQSGAIGVASAIAKDTAAHGTVTATSGNGGDALLYLGELPNTAGSIAQIKTVIAAVSGRYGTDTQKVDPQTCIASSGARVYGSWNRKGDGTPDRPHRRSQLIDVPAERKPINLGETKVAEHKAKGNGGSAATLDQVEEMLSHCPAHFGDNSYQKWINVLMAVHSVYPGEDGVALCEKYMPGKSGEIARKFGGFNSEKDGGVTIATLANIAKEYGYQPHHERNSDESSTADLNFGGGSAGSTTEYGSDGDAMYRIIPSKRKGEDDTRQFIADFEARITKVISSENGAKTYTLSGQAKRGGSFTCEIGATDFEDTRSLKSALGAAAGYRDPIFPGMAEHLAPAIKILSGGNAEEYTRLERTGWYEGSFIAPGLEAERVTVSLNRRLPYRFDSEADLAQGLKGLDALVRFMGAECATPLLAFLFTAPFAHPADLRNERAAMFIVGRSGTFKTSATQVAMSIYGASFTRDEMLLKWGEGATINALMDFATRCADVPMFIDNYKPNTASKGMYTTFTHAALEGGEKERLSKASVLKDSRPIHTWPISTGEDMPTTDPASLARHLIIQMPRGGSVAALAEAQAQADSMNAIGRLWVEHLMSDQGRAQASAIRNGMFAGLRQDWIEYLGKSGKRLVNPYRIATNLAVNQMTWEALMLHPALGEWAKQHVAAHIAGLRSIADNLVGSTSNGLEANRFIEMLREVIASGRGYLIPGKGTPIDKVPDPALRARSIGWVDESGIYLFPQAAIELIRSVSGDALGGVSSATLYQQLKEIDAIQGSDSGKLTKKVLIAGARTTINTLWLKSGVLEELTEEEEDTREVIDAM